MNKIFILLIFLFIACKEKDNVQDAVPMNYRFVEDYNNKDKIDSLCNQVLLRGDTLAFRELQHIYLVSEHSEEFLYLSTVMAEKYNYRPAFKTNYHILKNYKQRTMQKLAIYNLIKSYELGNRNDMQELNKMFPKGIPKSVEYWSKG